MDIKAIRNERQTFSSGVNCGVQEARGDLLMIVGTHCEYPPNYVSECVRHADRADNVGCSIRSVNREKGIRGKMTNIVRHDVFGAGRSPFRQGTDKPVYVDTVFGGCYKREVFQKIGLFNEKLERSSDMEFNLRLKEAGMKTLLIPNLQVTYFARSGIREMMRHNFKDGMWVVLPRLYSSVKWGMRYFVPMAFLLSLPLSIWPYLLLAFVRSGQIAAREREWRYALLMPWVFLLHHLSYGAGSLWAVIKIMKGGL